MRIYKEMAESDRLIIDKIAKRVNALYAAYGNNTTTSVAFALQVCHVTVCPLRLVDMFNGSDSDLVHDIGGIFRHMDAANSKMRDCFQPRFAQ